MDSAKETKTTTSGLEYKLHPVRVSVASTVEAVYAHAHQYSWS